jgi:transposase
MKVTRVGLDIAKQVFQAHGVDARGVPSVRKRLARAKVLEFFVTLPPCLIGIEASGGAHYWARELTKLGHTVKLIAAQFVTPYRKRDKNDANDAEAICEAVGRQNMHFVAVKSEEQQAVLMVHRPRTLALANRTAQVSQIRGLLGEFGLVVPQGVARLRRELPGILEDTENGLPVLAREVLAGLLDQFHDLTGASRRTIVKFARWRPVNRRAGSCRSRRSDRRPQPRWWRAWAIRTSLKAGATMPPPSGLFHGSIRAVARRDSARSLAVETAVCARSLYTERARTCESSIARTMRRAPGHGA